jgi:hypothetical protein
MEILDLGDHQHEEEEVQEEDPHVEEDHPEAEVEAEAEELGKERQDQDLLVMDSELPKDLKVGVIQWLQDGVNQNQWTTMLVLHHKCGNNKHLLNNNNNLFGTLVRLNNIKDYKEPSTNEISFFFRVQQFWWTTTTATTTSAIHWPMGATSASPWSRIWKVLGRQ